MSDLDEELASQWMEKARHDLFTAQRVLDAEDGPTDTPCFHAQPNLIPDLEQFREVCAQLSEYAVQVRYPSESADPDRTGADNAAQAAVEIFALGACYLAKSEE